MSGLPASMLIGGPEEELLRICAGQQQQQHVRNQNLYSHGGNHRYNAKAAAVIHRCQMKNIHMRSQSMPEDVYLKYNLQQQQIQRHPSQLHNNQSLPQHQQQQQTLLQQQQQHHHQQQPNVKLEKRMSFANPTGTTNVSLKRSQTNAADLGSRLSAVQHFVNERQRFESSQNSLNAARSRSNIAALNWNIADNELYVNRVPMVTNLTRATSFYHRDQLQPARSMGFLGPPCKDLSRPLHVDCSVEYDLGNQPRIPKNSAPLLIIHPAYQQQHHLQQQQQQQQQQQRFHPYSSIIDFGGDSSMTSHYDVTMASRLPNSRFTSGYHNNQTSLMYQPQPQQKFEFEITQSAPPKPQHRVTRHSSFLVGGGVSARQMSQFRPIVHEDESLYFNPHPYHQPRSFAPFMEASTMNELFGAQQPSGNYHGQHQMSTSIKRSKSIHHSSRGFHLSMPDISMDENFQQLRRHQQLALRTNGQHHHPRNSRARTNLEAKLEAARKMSSESRDSGTSLDSNHSDALPSFIDEDDLINEEICSVTSPPQKSDSGTGHPSQAFSDSGLGTPSSLMDQDGIEPGTSYSSSTSSHHGGSSSSSMSKWKSSVSGGSQVVWRAFVSSLKCMHF